MEINNFERIEFTVTQEMAGERIDKVLIHIPEVRTRSRVSKLIEMGLISFKGKPIKASQITKANEVYEILLPIEVQKIGLQPYDFPLDVVYEDAILLVINKPSGIVVHPAAGHRHDTLVNALIARKTELSMGFNEERPGIVHRLDKETSGLLLVAKTDAAHESLSKQFRERKTHRIYWAIAHGFLKKEADTIKSNIVRHPQERKRFTSLRAEGGRTAITHYVRLKDHNRELSLVALKLETGRTHQIRVHLSDIGHPIVGDNFYGASGRANSLKSLKLKKIIKDMNRFALHAAELGFFHPITQEYMEFHCGWPEDLKPLVESCSFEVPRLLLKSDFKI